jgi:hypothetical protein
MGLVEGLDHGDWQPKPMAVIAPATAAIVSVAVIATSSAIVEGHSYWLSFVASPGCLKGLPKNLVQSM